jgi:hypothetical protein
MDIEWLLSTLFDASLLSTSSRRQRRLFFLSHSGTPGAAMVAALLSFRGNYVAKFAICGLDIPGREARCLLRHGTRNSSGRGKA